MPGAAPTRPVALLAAGSLPFRNAAQSGLLDALSARGIPAHLVVLQRLLPVAEVAAPAGGASALREAPVRRPARGKPALDALVRAAFARRHHLNSYSIFDPWDLRDAGWRVHLRSAAVNALAPLAGQPVVFRRLAHATDKLTWRGRDLAEVERHLRALDPVLLVSSGAVYNQEKPYLEVARRLGIPRLGWVLSFDNLTSRSMLPQCEAWVTWNARMADRLHALYPGLGADRVAVCGTPQFDFHRAAASRWTRADVLSALQLAPDERYVLYAANHRRLTPTEPDLVRSLAARMAADAQLRAQRLVVRLHPLDDLRRWAGIELGGQVALSLPWTDVTTGGMDNALLSASLAHADACLSVASTMTLDAAVTGTPAVSIAFASTPGSDEDRFYAAMHRSDHFAPITANPWVRVTWNLDGLLAAVRDAVEHPTAHDPARRRLIEEECGPVDGGAAERVAAVIAGMVGAGDGAIPAPGRQS